MKSLILLVTLLFTVSAMAEMPAFLKGGTVVVTLKNGKTFTYKSEEMAVVKRANMQLPIVKATVKALKEERIVPNKKNRIYVLGGFGSTNKLEASTNGSTYEIKQKQGAVGGIGYQRKISQKLNVGVQVQTNGTSSLSVGTDF